MRLAIACASGSLCKSALIRAKRGDEEEVRVEFHPNIK